MELHIQTWDDLRKADLELIWQVNDFMLDRSLAAHLDRIISDNPFQDISLLTWAALFGGTMEYGMPCFWIAVVNLFVVSAIRRLVEAKRHAN